MNNIISSNPWPGLGAYDETGRYKFCGRGRATNELYSLISNNAVVSLFGRSGIGKTSLLKAGVTPLLVRKGFLPVYVRLSQEEKVPDENGRKLPYAECIIRCIEKMMGAKGLVKSEMSWKAGTPEDTEYLWPYFCKTVFQTSEGEHCTPVIILDQFEEIFHDRREDAAMLMRQLYALVNGSRRLPDDLDYDDFRSRFRFVMSFRDDSLYRLEDVINEYNLASFKENRYLLKALSRDDALDVVTEPGEDLVEDDVANQILGKVVAMGEGGSVDPAILSLLMYGFYERMIQKGESSIQGTLVAEAGNDIVRDFYERGMSGIGLLARKYLEEHLVSSDGRRRSVAAADASRCVKDEELKLLADKHILTKLERGSYSDYELTHDVLCPIVSSSAKERETAVKLRKVKHMVASFAVLFLVVFFIAMVFHIQRRQMLINRARFIAEKAEQLAECGDSYSARRLLLEILHSENIPYVAEIERAMRKAEESQTAILRGHDLIVTSAAFSASGKFIVSASHDHTIKIWDSFSGQCCKTLEGHTDYVNSAFFSNDDKYIVSASRDETIMIWDTSSGECIKIIRTGARVLYAIFSPDGKYIVSTSTDDTAKIWDTSTGKLINTLIGHQGNVHSAAYSPDGKYIATASWDNTIKIWNALTGQCINTLNGHSSWLRSVSYSPDGKYIASASDDHTIRIWDADTGQCISTLIGHSHYVNSVSFSPDAKYIVSSSEDETVKIWDTTSGKCIEDFAGYTDGFRFASFSPDGSLIIAASRDHTIKLLQFRNNYDSIYGTSNKVVQFREDHDIEDFVFSPDGKHICTSTIDSIVKIWDTASGKCIKELNGHSNKVNSVAYSPDGMYIVSASKDGTAKIWDISSGQCIHSFWANKYGCESAYFDNSGQRLLLSYSDTIKILMIESGECIRRFFCPWADAKFSPNNKQIISKSGLIFDLSSNMSSEISEGTSYKCTFTSNSPDGSQIATLGEYDRKVTIWDAASFHIVQVLYSDNEIGHVSFSPTGKQVIAASGGQVKIWDVNSGICVYETPKLYHALAFAQFSPDGKHFASCTPYEHIVRIWKLISFQDLIDINRNRFKYNPLTPEERHKYYLE